MTDGEAIQVVIKDMTDRTDITSLGDKIIPFVDYVIRSNDSNKEDTESNKED